MDDFLVRIRKNDKKKSKFEKTMEIFFGFIIRKIASLFYG